MSLVTVRGKSWRSADVRRRFCTCAYIIYAVCDSSAVGRCQMLRECGSQSVWCMCTISCIHLRPVAGSWLIPCADKSCGCNFPSADPGVWITQPFYVLCCYLLLPQCASMHAPVFFYTNYIWSARAIVFFLAISNDNLRLRNSHVKSLERQESVLACEHVHNRSP